MRVLSFATVAVVALATSAAHAVITADVLLNNTNQIRTAGNLPFFGAGTTANLAGVNFHYQAGSAVAGGSTLNGVGFDNIDLNGAVPPAGPFALTANPGGATLGLNFAFTADNSPRFQAAGAAGPDAAVLNLVANETFYISAPGIGHDSATMNFGNLGANRNVHVQVIGGDGGWDADVNVLANGNPVGTWTTVADLNASTASLFAFDAVTNGAGGLSLNFTATNTAIPFAEIAGVIITGQSAAPPPVTFLQAALTNTNQVLAPGGDFQLAAAVDLFHPGSQPGVPAPGSVNGIPFQNIAFNNPLPQALALGGSITLSPNLGDRTRFQNTAGTISGPDELVLEGLTNTINFLGSGEQLSTLLTGLPANRNVRVQVIGGDDGADFNNWLGDLEISANGSVVGTWTDVADDERTTASIATFFATTNSQGQLNLTFRELNPDGGPFVGIAALIVSTQVIPEPATLGLFGLGALALLRRRRAA